MLAIKNYKHTEQNQVLLEYDIQVVVNAANIWESQNIILQAPST